jgi:hypothetical protein
LTAEQQLKVVEEVLNFASKAGRKQPELQETSLASAD